MPVYDEKETYQLTLNNDGANNKARKTTKTLRDGEVLVAETESENVVSGVTPENISPKLQLVLDFYNQTFADEIAAAQDE